MPDNQTVLQQISIHLDGTPLKTEALDLLIDVEIDTSLNLPDMFTMRFNDPELELMSDTSLFKIGAEVKIGMASVDNFGEPHAIINGEITGVEPEFSEDLTATLTVRGYDKSHRLNRGAKSRVFKDVKHSDVVKQIASENGLSPNVTATQEKHEHVYQSNVSDFEFIRSLAQLNNYEVFYDGKMLYFRPPRGDRGSVSLKWGETLRSFSPHISVSGQVDEVVVRGWHPVNKEPIEGVAKKSSSHAKIGEANGKSGGEAASPFGKAVHTITMPRLASAAEAKSFAEAMLDDINSGYIEAEGLAFGNPELVAGTKAKIEGLGSRFSGEYTVTSAIHHYSQSGYDTQFRVEGARARQMADLVANSSGQSVVQAGGSARWTGVAIGIVTNTEDPMDLGRVLVQFPWLDQDLESTWARLVGTGAHEESGFYWLPDIGDEVLVAFANGDVNEPYILGSLWNDRDRPPESVSQALDGGLVVLRTLKTPAGHILRFNDKNGDKKIEIIGAGEGVKIVVDTEQNTLTIETKSNITIDSTSNIDMKAKGNITLDAKGNLVLKAAGMGELSASGNLTIKGAMVNIN